MRKVAFGILLVLVVAFAAVPAFAQATQYFNEGWRLLPTPHFPGFSRGNCAGYFEGDCIPFRVIIDNPPAGEFSLLFRADYLLKKGGKDIFGIDELHTPVADGVDPCFDRAYDNNFLDWDGTSPFNPTSTRAPFRAWGGTLTRNPVLISPGPHDHGQEQELVYRVWIDAGGSSRVIIGTGCHLAVTEFRRNGSIARYGSSFWPGSRIHVCLDVESDPSASGVFAKCVPIPVAFRQVCPKTFRLTVPTREINSFQTLDAQANVAFDPAGDVYAALYSRDGGTTWVNVPLSFKEYQGTACTDTTCPSGSPVTPCDDLTVLEFTVNIEGGSSIIWTFGTLDPSDLYNATPSDIVLSPQCRGGPEVISCPDPSTPILNECEWPLKKVFCVSIPPTGDRLATRRQVFWRIDGGAWQSADLTRFCGLVGGKNWYTYTVEPVYQGQSIEFYVRLTGDYPGGFEQSVLQTETICDSRGDIDPCTPCTGTDRIGRFQMHNPIDFGVSEKTWIFRVDNSCAVQSVQAQWRYTHSTEWIPPCDPLVPPDAGTLDLTQPDPANLPCLWSARDANFGPGWIQWRYKVTLTDGSVVYVANDTSWTDPLRWAACDYIGFGERKENPGCLEIPVVKTFYLRVDDIPAGVTQVWAKWKYSNAITWTTVNLRDDGQGPDQTAGDGIWTGDARIAMRVTCAELQTADGCRRATGENIDVDFGFTDPISGNDCTFACCAIRSENVCGLAVSNRCEVTFPRLTACKFCDLNGNGVRDNGEALLPGWSMTFRRTHDCTGASVAGPTVGPLLTGENGCVTVTNLLPGTWEVCETEQACWTRITPLCVTRTLGVLCGPTPDSATVGFANVVITRICGRTPGYWQGPNGCADVAGMDLTRINNCRPFRGDVIPSMTLHQPSDNCTGGNCPSSLNFPFGGGPAANTEIGCFINGNNQEDFPDYDLARFTLSVMLAVEAGYVDGTAGFICTGVGPTTVNGLISAACEAWNNPLVPPATKAALTACLQAISECRATGTSCRCVVLP